VLKFADQAHISTVLLLPGTILPGQNREEAAAASIRSLREMQSLASGFKATLCIEPHVQSYADSPGMALRIAEETGVSLTVDYAHFVCLGYRQNEIDPLLRHAGHMHLRQARPGVLQCKFAEGVVNFPALFGALRSAGYQGYLAIEYLHQANFNTLFDDVLTETIAVRDCMLRWMQDGPTK
jgi:sugar phosphate isomerase/epimerase